MCFFQNSYYESRVNMRTRLAAAREKSKTTQEVRETRHAFVAHQKKCIDADFEQQLMTFAKRNRPCVLTTEEKLDILLLQMHFRKEYEENQVKVGPGWKAKRLVSRL